jgi:hypothetical protein
LIILISTNISSQSLKGGKKIGGVQEGKPFSIIYSNYKVGTYNESTVSFPLSQSYDLNSTIFFNFNNTNNIKIVFASGQHVMINNIRNIINKTESYFGKTSEADATTDSWSGGKQKTNVKIRFTERDFQIEFTDSNNIIEFSYPKN